jgi:5-methylcytosine-specific restriction enzyme A
MTTRLRGRKLQAIRADHFAMYPLCVDCTGETPVRFTLATELDHIIPLEQGGLDFDVDMGLNRQGLCSRHHEIKTARDRGYTLAKRIGLDGFPIEDGAGPGGEG